MIMNSTMDLSKYVLFSCKFLCNCFLQTYKIYKYKLKIHSKFFIILLNLGMDLFGRI